jgi:hypothetical protein
MAMGLGKNGLNFPEHKEKNIKKKEDEGRKRRTAKLLSGKLIIPFLVHPIFYVFLLRLFLLHILYSL